MSLKTRHQDGTRGLLPRAVGLVLTLGGLTSSIVVAGSAGALSPSGKSLVISTTTNPKYGTILVSGTPIYTLKTSSRVSCGIKCVKVWPEVLLPKGVKKAEAGKGVDAMKLGTVKRRHGTLQATYAGKPLYWFAEDDGTGHVNGEVKDKWGTWAVVVTAGPANAPLQPAPGATTAPTTSPTSTMSPTRTAPTGGKTGVTMLGGGGTTPIAGTTPTAPPTTTPATAPPPPTTVPTTTPTTTPPTTTTTSPGGGGVGF